MKKKKYLSKLFLTLLIITLIACIPFIVLFIYAKGLPNAYTDSYYAALPVKYDYLSSIEDEKVVVIGGSSVAFGIDSTLLSSELNMPCANMGLYAAFGFKPMLDLSIGSIKKGDIVVLAPELSTQMYSDYIGYDYILEAIEGRTDMAMELGFSYTFGLIGALPDYVSNSKKLIDGGGVTVSGVYAKSSFDNNGNMTYVRDSNIMDEMYSPDNPPEINTSLVSSSFVDMVNEFVSKCERKGATVYFSFCPINAMSVSTVSDDDKKDFVSTLKDKLNCKVIASLDDHIMDAGYFYDSNFHTNDAGIILNTVLLINDIKRESGNMTLTNAKIPAPLSSSAVGDIINEGAADGFTYAITSQGVTITGLDDTGKKLTEITVPSQIENYTVTKIGVRAFEDSNATTITLPDTITALSSAIFANAKNLTTVYLNSSALPEVGNGLLTDANTTLKIQVPESLYGNFVTDYFWGQYSETLTK